MESAPAAWLVSQTTRRCCWAVVTVLLILTASDAVYSRMVARRASTSSMMGSGTVSIRLPLRAPRSKHAWLVTADHAGRSGSYALERNREPTPAREAPASGDRQDDRHPGQLIESVRGNDQYRSSALLFMTSRGVETDKPDVAALHYNSSLPAGMASIQSRSSEERAAGSSHCARSSSSE